MRFFFHLFDGVKFLDLTGEELRDDASAVRMGENIADYFARENPTRAAAASVEIADGRGRVVAVLACAPSA